MGLTAAGASTPEAKRKEMVMIGEYRKAPYFGDPLCPRCGVETLPFGYPGALSRADNKTEICSDCGVAEALEDYAGGRLGSDANPETDWPVRKGQ